MRFKIEHTTTYAYSGPAFLEPHIVRLCPRNDTSQPWSLFDLHVDPAPAGRSDQLDAEGNSINFLWFEGLTERLELRTRCQVETFRKNAFDYLIEPEAAQLPLVLPPALAKVLQPFVGGASGAPAVLRLVQELLTEFSGETLAFLSGLAHRLYEEVEFVIREDGDPYSPARTLELGQGSCRDLAVVFMDACRTTGLAARFVSGYQEGDADQEKRDLHAWAEVYVPGGGWRGYDPSHGLAVTDGHVALAASWQPSTAAPVSGSLRGTGVAAVMETDLTLTAT